jgi:2-methylisocitrate lyase-like PEP mutase family enzyme
LTARVLEDLGAEAVYLSGAGIANSYLGVPDIGLLTLTELSAHVAAVREVVQVPLVVDADTGFGNAVGVHRTVRVLQRAGADAIQIEDQASPKRCGHFAGKQLISAEEMVQKVSAAVDARTTDDLLIIARTDARAESGLQVACERARRYLDAGADVAFVEAPRSRAELEQIPRRVGGPVLVNMVEGGLTPITPLDELQRYGYAVVLYANTALRAALAGMRTALSHLLTVGDTNAVSDQVLDWSERQRLVGKPLFDALSERYGSDGGSDRERV